MSKIYAGQFFRISVETSIDLTDATSLAIKYTAPDKTTGTWTATIDPADNTKMIYDVSSLTQVGKWYAYGKATFTSGSIPGEKTSFNIYTEGE